MPILLSSDPPLRVVTSGDDRRPPLLLINPLGTTLEVWDPLVERLTDHNFVIRYDQRGHGESGPVGGSISWTTRSTFSMPSRSPMPTWWGPREPTDHEAQAG